MRYTLMGSADQRSDCRNYAAPLFRAEQRGCDAFSNPVVFEVVNSGCWSSDPRQAGEGLSPRGRSRRVRPDLSTAKNAGEGVILEKFY